MAYRKQMLVFIEISDFISSVFRASLYSHLVAAVPVIKTTLYSFLVVYEKMLLDIFIF